MSKFSDEVNEFYALNPDALAHSQKNQIKTKSKLEMEGQLWEECERCGEEPIYTPLFICESCWPT